MFASILFLWHLSGMTTIKEIPVANWVNILISSTTEAEMQKAIDHYLTDYNPAGYMTKFDRVEYDPTHGYCVTGNRLASCD